MYLCVLGVSWLYQNTASNIEDTQPRKHQTNCGGTRVLVPGHQNSGALSSWQLVFYCRLENGHQEYQFVFFPKCVYVFLILPDFIRTLPVKMRICNKKMQHQISGAWAPEVWCPFKLTGFFIIISWMNIRNINLSFIPSVFMCSWRFLVLSEYCQHNWGYTTKKTLKELWGHQSPGARAPELWCPFKLKTGFLF